MRILLVDNYDSFTYNLLHYLEPLVDQVDVVLNDAVDISTAHIYDGFVFSPGPGLPADAGAMPALIERFYRSHPMLGICLGMQGIAEFFGGKLINLNTVIHGRPQTCRVLDLNDVLYRGLPETFEVGHYHSWIISELPQELKITAVHREGWPLSISHTQWPVSGVQYHPESVMTPVGRTLIKNWVDAVRRHSKATETS